MVTSPLPDVSPSPRRPLPATQAEVASLAGCCRQTVAKWARGGEVHPVIDASIRLAVRRMEKQGLKQAQNIDV